MFKSSDIQTSLWRTYKLQTCTFFLDHSVWNCYFHERQDFFANINRTLKQNIASFIDSIGSILDFGTVKITLLEVC